MSNRLTASLDHAEMLVDAAVVLTKSRHPHDLIAVLSLAQAAVIVACNPPGQVEPAADACVELAGPALAEMIREVQRIRLTEAKPEGSA